jgi:translation initiation factor IF-3
LRLIGADGEQVGVISLQKALEMASEAGLDLALVSPRERPPVAKIMDYGKYLYRLRKQSQHQKKSQVRTEMKGVRFTVRTSDHDLETKSGQARRFLEKGHPVKVAIVFKGREITHAQLGREKIERFLSLVQDISNLDAPAKLQGHQMTAIISPALNKAQKSK